MAVELREPIREQLKTIINKEPDIGVPGFVFLKLCYLYVTYVKYFIKGMQKKVSSSTKLFLNWRICQKEFPAQIYFQYFHQYSFIEKGSLFFLNFQTNLKLSTVLKMHWVCFRFNSNFRSEIIITSIYR